MTEFTEAELATYNKKIKTPQELRKIIGPFPRKKPVIMCHGTFDLVHPGHIRHLIYAKSKASILVTSLTADEHIKKANYRPFVPQELRAMNLAALEIVDYVLIDPNETPIENLKNIQPDYFAKGYEYTKKGLPPKTQEEVDTLNSYGGEVIFTPGDIVYSSSHIIETEPPNLANYKLESLMKGEGIDFNHLRNALKNLKGTKVHVIGDTIVDTYSHCTLIGSNAKTPTFSVKYDYQTDYVGGAGIVAKHMKAAGADVTFTTVLGKDKLRTFVLDDLEAAGVKCNAIIDKTRPTTNKNLFTASQYRMLKVDTVDNRAISEKTLRKFSKYIERTESDAVVFSDFRHGIFNPQTTPELIKAIPKNTVKVADSQVASRWGNILDFKGFDLITPNEKEARFSLADQDSTVRPLALNLYKEAACKYLILKMGERGAMTYREPTPDTRAFFTIDSFVDVLKDPVGAGDALLAYTTIAIANKNCIATASILGSLAAALACEQDGNTPIGIDKLIQKIDAIEKNMNFR
jgi:rfaE bifunctional protein kinase chain/domain